jgi:hypothetical protein
VPPRKPGRPPKAHQAHPSNPGHHAARSTKRKPSQLPRSPPAAAGAVRDKSGGRRPSGKGPLAAVLAAEKAVGPGSSNTTTSTRGVGGANRPIKELSSYHQVWRDDDDDS